MSSPPRLTVKGKTRTNARRWTLEERVLFAKVLVDSENNYLKQLEQLAHKYASNDAVIKRLTKTFEERLSQVDFITLNQSNSFVDKVNGKLLCWEKLDTSTFKIRNQLKHMKCEWKKIHDLRKIGHASGKLPEWFTLLDTVLTEENYKTPKKTTNIKSERYSLREINNELLETTFSKIIGDEDSDDESCSTPLKVAHHEKSNSTTTEIENNEETCENNELTLPTQLNTLLPPVSTSALVVEPHTVNGNNCPAAKKQRREESTHVNNSENNNNNNCDNNDKNHNKALAEIAGAVKKLAESQTSIVRMILESEMRRDEQHCKFLRDEAERNRQHELNIAQVFASALNGNTVVFRTDGSGH